MIDAAISRAGLERRVTSVRTPEYAGFGTARPRKVDDQPLPGVQKAIEEDHVSVLVMGCTGIVGINAEMVNRLRKDGYDIPVLEAAQCAMTLLELYAKMGLYQSRETYMEPPKKDSNTLSINCPKSQIPDWDLAFWPADSVPVFTLIRLCHLIALKLQVGISQTDPGVRRHRFCNKGVASNNRALPNPGFAAQN